MPTPASLTPCKNPKCRQSFVPNRSGRPKEYCAKRCRDAAYRAGRANPSPDDEQSTARVREIAVSLTHRVDDIRHIVLSRDTSEHASLDLLKLSVDLARDAADFQTATIQQARDRRLRTAELARVLRISPDGLRARWPASAFRRRMDQRAQRLRQESGDAFVSRQRRPEPPGPDPGATRVSSLARALSTLHRRSGQSLRLLSDRTGVSASYLSRVLTGTRRPSWPVARRLAAACGGEPSEIRPLWDAASLRVPEEYAREVLHSALRGMHLAAGEPNARALTAASRGRLTPQDVTGLLQGGLRPVDWALVDRFVRALHCDPGEIRPLWEAAHPYHRHALPRTVPAAAFG